MIRSLSHSTPVSIFKTAISARKPMSARAESAMTADTIQIASCAIGEEYGELHAVVKLARGEK